MRFHGVISLFCLFLTALNTNVSAQAVVQSGSTASPATFEITALSADQERELTQWLAAIKEWQQYDAKLGTRPARDGWGRIVERKRPPAAPVWLASRCAELSAAHLLGLEPQTAGGCRLLDDPRISVVQAARIDAEKPPEHSSFLTRVHLDVLATTSQMGSRIYGIVGSHLSLVDVGRVQFFGPPGVLLLTVPDGKGGRRMTFGYTWGLSVRLADIRLNGPTKNMTLFLNVSKVWLGSGEPLTSNRSGYDIIGFSIAPRKKS